MAPSDEGAVEPILARLRERNVQNITTPQFFVAQKTAPLTRGAENYIYQLKLFYSQKFGGVVIEDIRSLLVC